jgi:hypothetical protein
MPVNTPYGALEGPFPRTRLDESLLTSMSIQTAAAVEVILPEVTPISDQVGGSCVANAFCDGQEILQGLSGQKVVQISRSAAYTWSRMHDGTFPEDKGTYPASMAKIFQVTGVLPESVWPHTEENLTRAVPVNLTMQAADSRVQGIHEIREKGEYRADLVTQSLRSGMPVVFCLHLTQDFRRPPEVIDASHGVTWGSHAMLLTGFRLREGKRQFLVRNSWGRYWGNNGYVWITQKLLDEAFGLYLLTMNAELVTPEP